MEKLSSKEAITKIQAVVVSVIIAIAVIVAAYFAAFPPSQKPLVTEVKIGGIYPLTGAYAVLGRNDRYAIELAVDEINEAGGVKSLDGALLHIIFADSEGDPKRAADEAERLITVDGVCAIMGSILSGTTSTSAPVAERYKVPYVNEGSTSITLTEHGWEYFFRVTPHDGLYCKFTFDFLKWLAKDKGVPVKTVALLYENTLFGKTAGDVWKDLLTQPEYSEWELVADIPYDSKSLQYDTEVMELKKAQPDVVFMATYTEDSIMLQKTFHRLDFECKAFIGIDGGHITQYFVEGTGKLGDYVFAEARWRPDLKRSISQEANARFNERYGFNLDGHSARAYTAAYVLYWAIEKAGSTNPEDIKNALVNLEIAADEIIMPWDGVKFDSKGQNILGKGCIVQIINGEFRSVYPRETATFDPVFPQPSWEER